MNQHENLAQELGNMLKKRNLTISAAESCTGGLFLSALTDIAGSSAYVLGGAITYSNEVKQKLVNVQEATLIQHGAVSEETAREMAIGVRDLLKADIGVSITGIAGPGGATPEKPVGLVYIGVVTHKSSQVRKYIWQGNRMENKQQSVVQAIQLVVDIINEETEEQ
ncbi:MAG: CinA family protein [Anaerolineae bacterium]|nr:CinA family protein [Anaerolineae bacterium]MDQ7034073.1 CinA family protein [Anaerolineae bacterium]